MTNTCVSLFRATTELKKKQLLGAVNNLLRVVKLIINVDWYQNRLFKIGFWYGKCVVIIFNVHRKGNRFYFYYTANIHRKMEDFNDKLIIQLPNRGKIETKFEVDEANFS